MTQVELAATVAALRQVMEKSWPEISVARKPDAPWSLTEEELQAELDEALRATETPTRQVRVFWKLGPNFTYRGCNHIFARDAGMSSAAALIGRDDLDPQISWIRQSAKYRADDKAVVAKGEPIFDIIERQDNATAGAVLWLRTSKAPIRPLDGSPIGILGMYEMIDGDTARKLMRRTS